MQTPKENITWIDNLRALAIFSVVFLHVSVPLLSNTSDYTAWQKGNIYDSLVRFCVPVFLMLSGALLLGSNMSLKDFLKKRYIRIIIPFLFWTTVYIANAYDYFFFAPVADIKAWLIKSYTTGVSYHMWYVYMVAGLYFFIPVLGKWAKNSKGNDLLYFLFFWLMLALIELPIFDGYFIPVNLSNFAGYAGYLVLGYYLSVADFKRKFTAVIGLILFAASVAATIFLTDAASRTKEAFDGRYYDYLSINVIAAATGIFLFFKNTRYQSSPRFIKLLSKHSYGIYLLHILVLNYVGDSGLNYKWVDPLIGVPITTICILTISLLIVWLVSKIPYIGKYISG